MPLERARQKGDNDGGGNCLCSISFHESIAFFWMNSLEAISKTTESSRKYNNCQSTQINIDLPGANGPMWALAMYTYYQLICGSIFIYVSHD